MISVSECSLDDDWVHVEFSDLGTGNLGGLEKGKGSTPLGSLSTSTELQKKDLVGTADEISGLRRQDFSVP